MLKKVTVFFLLSMSIMFAHQIDNSVEAADHWIFTNTSTNVTMYADDNTLKPLPYAKWSYSIRTKEVSSSGKVISKTTWEFWIEEFAVVAENKSTKEIFSVCLTEPNHPEAQSIRIDNRPDLRALYNWIEANRRRR